MKRIFIFSIPLMLISFNSASAQTGAKFGFKAGYSMATQYGINQPDLSYTVETSSRHGFAGGVFVYFPVTESFGVQQEFLYANKGSTQSVAIETPMVSTVTEYKIDYFELPILFRYKFVQIKNVGIYGSSGFALSLLLDGSYDLEGEVDIGGMKIPLEESGKTDGLDDFDYSFVYGLGIDFNLFDKLCFFEYRQTIGWNTLMMPTGEGQEPAPLRNQDYIFTLGLFL